MSIVIPGLLCVCGSVLMGVVVESIEFGGDKEMFVQKEATLLDGFGLRRFAQSTL